MNADRLPDEDDDSTDAEIGPSMASANLCVFIQCHTANPTGPASTGVLQTMDTCILPHSISNEFDRLKVPQDHAFEDCYRRIISEHMQFRYRMAD